MANISDKKITFTLIFQPMQKGKPRQITVAGAPDGEMPVIKSGTFADRHSLVDVIWKELTERAPQIPKHTEPKKEEPKASEPAKDEQPDEAQAEEADASEPPTEQPAAGGPAEPDQLVAQADDAPADLPVIDEPAGEPPAEQPAISPLEAAIIAAKSE